MLKIIADEKIPFLKGILEPYANVIYLPASNITQESVKNADALIIRTRTKCDYSLLEGTSIKFIATATIGYDHIDEEFCLSKGIQWKNAPGCNSSSVQQYVVAALMMLLEKDYNISLSDKSLGIIGVGNVGSKIEAAAHVMGIKTKLNDPPRARIEGASGFVHLDEIVETCDIISLHVPLIYDGEDKTFQLFNNKLFGKVKQGASLINTARGEVVETRALMEALSSGRLGRAVFDVWENEPFIDQELLSHVDIATPHIAGYSSDGKANGTAQAVQSLSRYFGFPLTDFYPDGLPSPVNPDIVINGSGKTLFQVINQAVLHTYPIMEDHHRLLRSPDSFEQLRGNYPVRREFSSYTVHLQNGSTEAYEVLVKLGFKVIIK